MSTLTTAGTVAFSDVYQDVVLSPENSRYEYRRSYVDYVITPSHNRPSAVSFQPRTDLGRRLWEIRTRSIDARNRPIGWEELEREINDRRSERDSEGV
jgi:hypothetical protein